MHEFLNSNNNESKIVLNPFTLETSGIPQISRHLLAIKPLFGQKRYADLDLFRQQIDESKAGLHHQPYTNNKRNTTFYKMVFLGFSALFFILSMVALSIPTALGCGFLFSSCSMLKGGIVSICVFLSLTALMLALRLKAEKEAIFLCVKKTKAYVAATYARKKVRLGIKNFFSLFGAGRQKALSLKQMYDEVCDKINDRKDETMHLVHRITTAETLDYEEKEDLLNQAIEELNEKLHALSHAFRHATP